MSDDYEDILKDSLEFLGGKPVIDDEVIKYGPLVLTVAPKHGKANTLLADHLFSPSIFLAERIERGLFADCQGKTVLELGAGAALPSLLLSTVSNPPKLVVVTDHPDEVIFSNLRNNVTKNQNVVNSSCILTCCGYEWGADVTPLLQLLSVNGTTHTGFDVLILSDLLHFDSFHDQLVKSITSSLKRSPDSRVHIAAGVYTKPDVCDSFLAKSTEAGLQFEEIHTNPAEPWKGTLTVGGLDSDDLATRKAACRYWVGHYARVEPY